jgi:hypothetical protein
VCSGDDNTLLPPYFVAEITGTVIEVLKLRDWLVDNSTLTYEVPSHNVAVAVCCGVSVATITGPTFFWRQ